MGVPGYYKFLFSVMSLSKWPPGGHIGFFQFPDSNFSLALKSSPNFTGTSLVCMERSLLIFSNVTFKMAAWGPYWIFQHLDSVVGIVSEAYRWHRTTSEAYSVPEIDSDGQSSPPSHQTTWQCHHFYRCWSVSGTRWRNGRLQNRLQRA